MHLFPQTGFDKLDIISFTIVKMSTNNFTIPIINLKSQLSRLMTCDLIRDIMTIVGFFKPGVSFKALKYKGHVLCCTETGFRCSFEVK